MAKKRTYGTGGLHEKHGSYYGRWRTLDGRQLNRLVGPVRTAGSKTGLTRSQAEAAFRRLQDEEERAPRPARGAVAPTVDDVTDSLRQEAAATRPASLLPPGLRVDAARAHLAAPRKQARQ